MLSYFKKDCCVEQLTSHSLKIVFEWVLIGTVSSSSSNLSPDSVTSCHISTDSSFMPALIKFWEIEEVPSIRALKPEKLRSCEKNFMLNFFRNAERRFAVRLPFSRREPFSDSPEIATACLLNSEKRRNRKPKLQIAYSFCIEEYRRFDHISLSFSRGALLVLSAPPCRNSPSY